MSNLPKVTIIVLNYNGLEHLKDCFSSLSKIDYPQDKLELMLVDNASKDGSVGYVKASFPQVRVVCNEDNLGFASGNNRGAREATGDYIIFLNNDMWVDPQFVWGLIKAVQSDPEVVSAGAKILNWDGSLIDYVGPICNYAGYAAQLAFHEVNDPQKFNKIESILCACGGAMIIDRQVFLDVGGFDDNYFIYFEDVDLGWRLWLLGYKVVLASDAVVYHRHHGTMKRFSNSRQMVLYKRNSLYTIIKNYCDENLGQILPAILLSTASGVVEQAVAAGQLDKDAFDIRSTKRSDDLPISLDKLNVSSLVAMQDTLEHLPQIMEKRRFVQQKRKRSDQEIAHLFRPFFFTNIPGVSPQASYTATTAFDVQKIFTNVSRRVLVFSPDLLPYPGLPTVGSGLRAWGLGQGLKSQGHDVIFSIPRAALKAFENVASPEVLSMAWEHQTMLDVIDKVQPDIILVCGWPVMLCFPQTTFNIPVILDQHGPHILERHFQNHGDRENNAREKIRALQLADFFTCAGNKQLVYFRSWLQQAGWTEKEQDERSAAMPISLSPKLPERKPQDELTFVYGGVFLPWQDPSVSLSVLIDIMEHRNAGKLYFFGGKHPWLSIDTGIFDSLLTQLQKSNHVIAPGTVPHHELIDKYTSAHVAIDVMKRNAERELAFTTRTVEYLWCGLPVIYNNYAELSDYIREYNAGWIVDPEDPDEIAAVINDIFDHPEQIAERSLNAQRLVRDKLNWEKTITAIDHFVRNPSMRYHRGLNISGIQATTEKQQASLMEIERLRAQIRGMNSSKFWQMRELWCQIKRSLGVGKDQLELVDRLRPYIQSNQLEPETLSQLISAMESSKFWKLRKAWFQFKETIGLRENP